MRSVLVVVHISLALLALLAGPFAVRLPNGTTRHRAIGKAYVAGWVGFGSTGVYLGALHPGISPFEILNLVGAGFVLAALYPLWRRARLGHRWRRLHYRGMLISYAFVAVATVNQLLRQAGLDYPFWVFIALAFAPFLILPGVLRRLDRIWAPAATPARGSSRPSGPSAVRPP